MQPLINRLQKNYQHFGRWAKKQNITCFRVYDNDLPEYACAIDIYQNEKTWIHIQEYQAPKYIAAEKVQQRLQEILQAVTEVFKLPDEQIIYKQRAKQKGKNQYEKQSQNSEFLIVHEQGLNFYVNLKDYLDTGLFLDHRITRNIIREKSHNKNLLNLFCYTATVSVYAAQGGAITTTSVDLSNTYLDWAQKNFELNQINIQNHQFIQADCMRWLTNTQDTYDLIFLDPPTFSNSKRMQDSFDIQKEHVFLIKQCMRLLSQDGLLIFSTNFKKFQMDREALQAFEIKDISAKTIPKDFARNAKIHYCWEIKF